jgi:hypothetical protein
MADHVCACRRCCVCRFVQFASINLAVMLLVRGSLDDAIVDNPSLSIVAVAAQELNYRKALSKGTFF